MSTQNICFRGEALLMSTHNICFRGEIRKILCGYPFLSVAMFNARILHDTFYYLGCIKRKRAFEHAQYVQIQIILHMHKVSPGPLPLIHTFCSFQ